MTPTQRILVTGSAGRIGRAVVQALVAAGHEVHGFDLRPSPGLPAGHWHVGNLTDAALLRQLMHQRDAVIHLAATPDDTTYPRPMAPADQDNFINELLPNNIIGTYNILEAARSVRLPRLVMASTGQVVWEQVDHGPWPLDEHAPFTPRYWYACTKVFMEMAATTYARDHQIPTVVVRLGWCPRDRGQVEQIAERDLFQDVYLSPGDAGRFFLRAVEAAAVPAYSVLYCTSKPIHQIRYDLALAKKIIGFEPVDQWPTDALP